MSSNSQRTALSPFPLLICERYKWMFLNLSNFFNASSLYSVSLWYQLCCYLLHHWYIFTKPFHKMLWVPMSVFCWWVIEDDLHSLSFLVLLSWGYFKLCFFTSWRNKWCENPSRSSCLSHSRVPRNRPYPGSTLFRTSQVNFFSYLMLQEWMAALCRWAIM